MARLVLVSLAIGMVLIGCGSSDATPAQTETEKTAITNAKATWSPEKVEAFKKAHAEDGRLTPGQKHAMGGAAAEQASNTK